MLFFNVKKKSFYLKILFKFYKAQKRMNVEKIPNYKYMNLIYTQTFPKIRKFYMKINRKHFFNVSIFFLFVSIFITKNKRS